MPCTYCDGNHLTKHCTERLEAYHGVSAERSVGAEADATVWVQDLNDEIWHASMYREDDVHQCACGTRLACPIGGVKPDGWRVDELDRCESCLAYLESEEETIPDGGEFERASELRADGGTCVDGTDRTEWPCHCEGENSDWRYHSEGGCAATGQAFAFVSGGRHFRTGTEQEGDRA